MNFSSRCLARLAGSFLFLALLTTASAKEPVLLQLWGLPEADSFEGWARTIDEYDTSHPEVIIERGSPGGQQQGVDPQKLMTASVAGTPPDLLWMDRFALAGWAARGIMMPLDEHFERDNINREDFYDACLEESIYEGKIYGLPWDTDSRALWCNMDLLEQHGFTEPPADWDELMLMAEKITKRTDTGRYETVGFAPLIGNSWLYLYGWLNGGEFMSEDGKTVTLADPKIVEALEWMDACYGLIGGARAIQDFQASMQGEGTADPFRSGRIALMIAENSGLDYIAKFTPDMNLKVVAPPPPKGRETLSWSGGYCWSIPKGAKAADEAWELAKYLASPQGWARFNHFQSEANKRRAKASGLATAYYTPRLSASRSVNAMQLAEMQGTLPPKIAAAFEKHVELLDICRFRPVTPVGLQLWDEHARATNNALLTDQTPEAALQYGQRVAQERLDKFLKPNPYPEYDLGRTVGVAFAALLAVALFIWFLVARRWKWTMRTRSEAKAGLLFATPWLIGFLVLMAGPMLASMIMAFSEYDGLRPARWVGLDNFKSLMGTAQLPDGTPVASDPLFWKSLRNTMSVTAIGVPLGIIVSLALALLLNAEIRGIRLYRTLLYVPVVIPAVAGSVLWLWFLNNETGVSGAVLSPLLAKFGMQPISFFADPRWMRTGLILLMLWAAGGSMIIWLAGLKSIPKSYYEAASIDGAGTIKQFFTITLPLLSPYMFFNVVMSVIAWLQLFVQPFVFITPPGFGPGDSMLYYMIYLFAQGFNYFNMGIACAMAWIMFLIVAGLTFLQFKIAPRWVTYDV